ncbi:MAG: archease [Proteobacteria bacterium]|nr:archease [Pseudomonadota bacterium]
MTSGSGTLEHTADLGLWVEADSLEELFASAPAVLAELMVGGPRDGQLAWLPLELQGVDHVELLVQLLSEVVYLWDAEGLITVAVKVVELTPGQLTARLGVIPADRERHQLNEPVKAVTYHQASVEPIGSRWRAEVFLDV